MTRTIKQLKMEISKEIIVKDGNFIRRTVKEQLLGPLTDIVEKASQSGYTIIPDAFSILQPSKEDYENDTYENQIKLPVHLGKAGSTLHVAHRLIYYPIYGNFRVTGTHEGVDRIAYAEESGDMMKVACDYPGVWIIYAFRMSNHRISAFQQCFLTTNIKGKHFAPLLPNIFNNGKICLGQINVHYDHSIQNCVQELFNELFLSASNDHLMTDNMWAALKFERKVEEGKKKYKWTPDPEFFSNPVRFHKERDTSVAAEFLENLTILEETDHSKKVTE